MIFHYSTSVAEDPATGDFIAFRRPEILLAVTGPLGSMALPALVDTGADRTILPTRVALRLGIQIDDESSESAIGFGGALIELHPGEALLSIESGHERLAWPSPLWFAEFPAHEAEYAILGHAGFLDFFTATFDGKEGLLTLVANDELPRAASGDA